MTCGASHKAVQFLINVYPSPVTILRPLS